MKFGLGLGLGLGPKDELLSPHFFFCLKIQQTPFSYTPVLVGCVSGHFVAIVDPNSYSLGQIFNGSKVQRVVFVMVHGSGYHHVFSMKQSKMGLCHWLRHCACQKGDQGFTSGGVVPLKYHLL